MTQEPSVMGLIIKNYIQLNIYQTSSGLSRNSVTRDNTPVSSVPHYLFPHGEYAGNYSYLYDGDMNNDGIEYDLIYIPRTKEGYTLRTDKPEKSRSRQKSRKEAFWTFINQDPI